MSDRVSLFVDGANFFYSQRDSLGWWVDPKKMLGWCNSFGQVVDATYYASVEPGNIQQEKYHKALAHMGFSLVTKDIKLIQQADGSEKHKANLDIEIVLDLFNTISTYDLAILVSGDADFVRPLQMLKARGKRFMVVSTKGFLAHEMRQLAGMHYRDLADLRELLEKD